MTAAEGETALSGRAGRRRPAGNGRPGASDAAEAAAGYSLGPVTRHSAPRLVAEELVRFIRDNQLQKGDRLPPTVQLARMMGVSLATLREALKELEAFGVVSARQGRGVFVKSQRLDLLVRPFPYAGLYPLEPAEVMDLMDARRLIEVETARLAARRAGGGHLGRMQELLELMRAEMERPDEFIQHDVAFHMAIAESSGNQVYPRLLAAVRETFLAQQKMAVSLPGAAERACYYHERLWRAIRDGDPEEASRAMAAHLGDIKRHLARALGVSAAVDGEGTEGV